MTIKLNAATGGGSVSLSAPNSTTSNLDVELTLPVDDGAADTFLKSDGAGTLSWASASSDSITEGNTSVECVDTGSNGHITFDTEGTERLRIESDGDVLSKPNNSFDIQATTTGVSLRLQTTNTGTAVTDGCLLQMAGDNNVYFYNKENADIRFGTNDTERMRIAANGRTSIVTVDTDSFDVGNSNGTGTSRKTIRAYHSASSVASGTEMFYVSNNGDVRNATGSYSSISDVKLKENIVDAPSQWDDIKALQVRKFNFTEESNQVRHTQIGLIAQEVETVCPGLVDDDPDFDENGEDLGTVTKGVKYSVLYMKSVKALQEAMTRIEALETVNASQAATIAALDARLTALEGGAS